MPSARFTTLEARINQLRLTFLPYVFDPTGTYEQSVLDKTNAFRLLVHAEFESFAEDIVSLTVKEAFDTWITSKKTPLPILCIVASYEGHENISSFSSKGKSRPINIATMLHRARNHFDYGVNNNHGLRTKNLLFLLVQVGIEESDLDATWVGSVDAFGAHRNIVGHQSGVVAYQADPKTAWDATSSILTGFRDLDAKLDTLRQSF